MSIKNQVQLITYPDSLGGDLKALGRVLSRHFSDIVCGGVHILPPFPSSGDRGFAPLTYLEIEPTFGSWEDVRSIAQSFDVMLDLMVNHISQQSVYFQDFLKRGRESRYADLFITVDKIWPERPPSREEIEKIFLRRTEPFSEYSIAESGLTERVWTTFGKQDPSEQIDMDMTSATARGLLTEFLTHFSQQGVRYVRLDAVGYVVKKPGTSCFFVEPEIYEFLDWISALARSLDLQLLPEVHAPYQTQRKLAEHGHWIYDFVLPYVVLETLMTRSSARLRDYLKERPQRQFTMLDCHDGVPVKPDLDGLVSSTDARRVVDICLERGSNLSKVFSPKHHAEDGFDVHQIRCSYYSALGCDDDAYIAARAIQFFVPGVPQVYYVGLLAGENDLESARRFEGRAINRHNFSVEEIERALDKAVVQRLLKLIRFRNTFSAFDGDFSCVHRSDHTIELRWNADSSECALQVDLRRNASWIDYCEDGGGRKRLTL